MKRDTDPIRALIAVALVLFYTAAPIFHYAWGHHYNSVPGGHIGAIETTDSIATPGATHSTCATCEILASVVPGLPTIQPDTTLAAPVPFTDWIALPAATPYAEPADFSVGGARAPPC